MGPEKVSSEVSMPTSNVLRRRYLWPYHRLDSAASVSELGLTRCLFLLTPLGRDRSLLTLPLRTH